METGQYYPDMFWEYCFDDYLVGLDAHSVSEMARRYHEAAFWNEMGEQEMIMKATKQQLVER